METGSNSLRELKLHRSWAGTGGSPARAAGGRGWGQGWCGATQHVSLREAPSSCETQTTPVPDKAGIFCLTLLTMPVLETVTHRVEFAGDVHARRVLVSPQHSPAAPCLLQARAKPQGTSCLSPKLHIQIAPRFLCQTQLPRHYYRLLPALWLLVAGVWSPFCHRKW